MAGASDFRVGDKVDSPAGFSGRVTRIERGTVYVEFSGKGGRNEGVYTPEWFAAWPTMLKKSWMPAMAGRRSS